ncbi:MAG TPA: hypothetical protein VMZ53_17540 [Kofleriaceae bacterium]|nr:hypothetical protein [Kofleriaceae bacterium]
MRFCPFCSAENADEQASCVACGRRLPPLPPRRAGSKGQPTGITLSRPPKTPTVPPPIPVAAMPVAAMPVAAMPAPAMPAPAMPPSKDSAPALPPPPVVPVPSSQGLLDAITPGPAAERRPPSPPESRIIADRRGANPKPLTTPPPMTPPSVFDRPKTSSVPPPIPGSGPNRAPSSGPFAVPSTSAFAADTAPSAAPLDIAPKSALEISSSRTTPAGLQPPPTRIHRAENLVDRPFAPPKVAPVPAIPEPNLINAAKYAYKFGIARWQRRGAIKQLGTEIKQDTEALDQVLGLLGGAARNARVEGRVFSAENTAITAAEERVASLNRESNEVDGRKVEENSKFVDVERERNEKLVEAERMVEEAQKELQHLEAQRRGLRDKRKELDRRQKAFLKNADDHDRQAGAAPLGDQRQELRRAAEGHRKEAAALEPEKQDIDRRLASLERPIGEATARLDAAKAELDAAKRSLNDAREGHTHRLAELDAEQKRKSREVALAEGEIQRRLVTLGTLVNLNRIEDPQFAELYQRIDRLRGAITARTTEIEKLTAEREAYDRGTLVRGVATIGGAFIVLIALIVILRAIL